MNRPTIDVYMSSIALLAARRGTCARRSVGCVLTSKLGHVISTGYNGVPRGFVHCTTVKCPGASFPSGQGLDQCLATHAEQNALLQCKDTESISTCYSTTAPCVTCTKLLLNTSCQNIVFLDDYPHSQSSRLWVDAGRTWHQLTSDELKELRLLLKYTSDALGAL